MVTISLCLRVLETVLWGLLVSCALYKSHWEISVKKECDSLSCEKEIFSQCKISLYPGFACDSLIYQRRINCLVIHVPLKSGGFLSSHMQWSAHKGTRTANVIFPCDSSCQPFWGPRYLTASGLLLLSLSGPSECYDPAVICFSEPTVPIFQQIQGTLKGWPERPGQTPHCLQNPLMVLCLLVKNKLERIQVRREKHNITCTMR